MDKQTILKYLKQGTRLGWCTYDLKQEVNKRNLKGGKNSSKVCSKKVEVLKDNISFGIFESYNEIERKSEKLLGVKLNNQGISRAILTNKKYKGFEFK